MQIRCLDSLPSHLPRTYHDVGQFACGQTGRVLVSAVTTLEYFGYACMQLILLWHQLEVSMHLHSTYVPFSAYGFMFKSVSARGSHASACTHYIVKLAWLGSSHGFSRYLCNMFQKLAGMVPCFALGCKTMSFCSRLIKLAACLSFSAEMNKHRAVSTSTNSPKRHSCDWLLLCNSA